MVETDRSELESVLGHSFREPQWLERALTHSSCRNEFGVNVAVGDNERLEFLGDAVLNLVVSEHLLRTFPEWTEGRLSKARARLVSARSLQAAARRLQLGRFLRLGRGEEKTGGREKSALLADAYEAVTGAIYLDGGGEAAAQFVRRSLLDEILREHAEALGHPDHKSALQEFLQARGQHPAEYRVVEESGPEHRKTFRVEVRVEGRAVAASEGSSKKEAEQAAARLALEQIRDAAESS